MPSAESSRCPACHASIAADAVLCVNCGYDLKTGRHVTAELDVTERHADVGWKRSTRAVIAVVVCVGLTYLIYSGLAGSGPLREHDYPIFALLAGFSTLATLALVGTYTRVRVTKDAEGHWTASRHDFIGFIPARPCQQALADCDAVFIDTVRGSSPFGCVVTCVLLCAAALPGLLTSYLLSRSETCVLQLGRRDEAWRFTLVRGGSERKFRRVIEMLRRVADLHVWRAGSL